ncbi:MAG: flagellar motor switch protein FliG [Burkholderiaceae bacterium]
MDENGLQDASILLMLMGAEPASEIFKHLSPKEVQKIGETMAGIKSLPKTRIDEVLDRFKAEAGLQSSLVDDTDGYVRDVLTKALGDDKANMLIDRILQGGDVSGIESLKWMTPDSIVELIRNEHPQIIASILVHLERDLAAAVLGRLDDRLRTDVTLRISTLDGIQPSALRELNDVLSKVLSTGDRMKKAAMGGTKTAAEILNFLGSSVETAVLESLRTADADLAQQITDQMFTFDDVMKLDDRSVQIMLREIQTDSLVIALKGADPELRDKIFRNMSNRAAEALREDLESKGPMRVSEVEAEQKEITKTIRRLADEGQISLGGGADDAYY